MDDILEVGKKVIESEAKSLQAGAMNLGSDFVETVQLFSQCTGRIIVTGIGKSAAIGSKIVATFNSTGSPAIFMHAAEAVHGDLGLLLKDDLVLCISNSGNSAEIKTLVPFINSKGNKIVSIVGNLSSYLAQNSYKILDATVDGEAEDELSAPTNSTTLQLAIGDALAICLARKKDFTNSDFAKLHPGGAIGKRLLLSVGEICSANAKPEVNSDSTLQEVIFEISSKRLGATAVIDSGILSGIITDGDIRRMLQENPNISQVTASYLMTEKPKTLSRSVLAEKAMSILNDQKMSQVIILDGDKYFGMIHLHDLVREGFNN